MKSHRLQLGILMGLLLAVWILFSPALMSRAGILVFTPTTWYYLPLIAINVLAAMTAIADWLWPTSLPGTVTPAATPSLTQTPTPCFDGCLRQP